jgi:hypothetical protein
LIVEEYDAMPFTPSMAGVTHFNFDLSFQEAKRRGISPIIDEIGAKTGVSSLLSVAQNDSYGNCISPVGIER